MIYQETNLPIWHWSNRLDSKRHVQRLINARFKECFPNKQGIIRIEQFHYRPERGAGNRYFAKTQGGMFTEFWQVSLSPPWHMARACYIFTNDGLNQIKEVTHRLDKQMRLLKRLEQFRPKRRAEAAGGEKLPEPDFCIPRRTPLDDVNDEINGILKSVEPLLNRVRRGKPGEWFYTLDVIAGIEQFGFYLEFVATVQRASARTLRMDSGGSREGAGRPPLLSREECEALKTAYLVLHRYAKLAREDPFLAQNYEKDLREELLRVIGSRYPLRDGILQTLTTAPKKPQLESWAKPRAAQIVVGRSLSPQEFDRLTARLRRPHKNQK